MKKNTNQVRYKNRLDALINNAAINDWKKKHGDSLIGNLIHGFQEFSIDYFNYFLKNGAKACEISAILGKIQDEWDIIERACQQRDNSELGNMLEQADRKAAAYFGKFRGIKATTPLVYFEKLYSITNFIFARSGFVSIPFQLYNDPSQWQGLAHEIGHFVYWNTVKFDNYRDTIQKAKDRVADELDELWEKWYEEVFADICGTLLAGPAYLDSALHRIDESISSDDELFVDDDIHPYPYLRPLISLETLKWVSNNLGFLEDEVNDLDHVISGLETQYLDNVVNRLKDRPQKDDISGDVAGVVAAILDVQDEDPHYVKINLGDIAVEVTFNAWQDELSKYKDQTEIAGFPEAVAGKMVSLFGELKNYLEERYPDDIKDILLSLDIGGQRDIGNCNNKLVKHVGYRKGNYVRC